jgi:hypothetical protein
VFRRERAPFSSALGAGTCQAPGQRSDPQEAQAPASNLRKRPSSVAVRREPCAGCAHVSRKCSRSQRRATPRARSAVDATGAPIAGKTCVRIRQPLICLLSGGVGCTSAVRSRDVVPASAFREATLPPAPGTSALRADVVQKPCALLVNVPWTDACAKGILQDQFGETSIRREPNRALGAVTSRPEERSPSHPDSHFMRRATSRARLAVIPAATGSSPAPVRAATRPSLACLLR